MTETRPLTRKAPLPAEAPPRDRSTPALSKRRRQASIGGKIDYSQLTGRKTPKGR